MKNKKILIIDDNPKNLQVAMSILSKEGYNLIYATSGEKGIELAKGDEFDLILLDVIMPNIDGFEVCKILKADEKTKQIPIIFLTVKDDEKDIVKGFECGGVDYVTKPFFTDVLLKRVDTHIKLYSITKNLEKEVEKKVEILRVKDQILFQQAKLASMGEMIANIAHQWRQPLGAISSTISVIKTKFLTNSFDFTTPKGIKECNNYIDNKLSDVEEYLATLSSTIDDFRNFFKPQKQVASFDVKELIQKSIKLLSANLSSEDIKIVDNSENIKIKTLKNELSQVLINILNNAKDAIITNKSIDKGFIFINTQKDEKYLVITIKDNGGGIDKGIIDRIFEPYFTTKDIDGTGIGLYMSKEIVQKHLKGSLEVKNVTFDYQDKSYKGAEFNIKIPL